MHLTARAVHGRCVEPNVLACRKRSRTAPTVRFVARLQVRVGGDGGEEFRDDFEAREDSVARGIETRDLPWGESTLSAVQHVLSAPGMEDLELYSFSALPDKSIDIRLDKMTDMYGSPSLADIEAVARGVNERLEVVLGGAAGEIEVNVSSPGAERPITADEVQRFAELPMMVAFKGEGAAETRIVEVDSVDEATGAIVWRLADVKGNSPGLGRTMNKSMRAQRWCTAPADLASIQLYIEL